MTVWISNAKLYESMKERDMCGRNKAQQELNHETLSAALKRAEKVAHTLCADSQLIIRAAEAHLATLPRSPMYTQQAFHAQGMRRFEYYSDRQVQGFKDELQNNLDVWLTIMGPLSHWRVPPEFNTGLDYIYGRRTVELHARGWLAKAVPIAEHQTWMLEL